MSITRGEVFRAIAGTSITDAAAMVATDRVLTIIDADSADPNDAEGPARIARTVADLDRLPAYSVVMTAPEWPGRFSATKDHAGMWIIPDSPYDTGHQARGGIPGEYTASDMVRAGRHFRVLWIEGVDR